MSVYRPCVLAQPVPPDVFAAMWEHLRSLDEPPVVAFFAGLHLLATQPARRAQ